MKIDTFVATRSEAWRELEQLVGSGHPKPGDLGAAGVRRLGWRYRTVAGDLAYARRAFPGDPVVIQLESLVARSRPIVYSGNERRSGLVEFIRFGYWRSVRDLGRLLLLSALLTLGVAALAGYWAWRSPDQAAGFVPSQFRHATGSQGPGDVPTSGGAQTYLAAVVTTNNVRVTLLAFGGGLLAGVGTAFVLIQNGLILGVIGGIAVNEGNFEPFLKWILPHGVIELTCVMVAGAAGLRLGRALISPGHEPRGVVLQREARVAVGTLVGTAAWLVVAGIQEGFVRSSGPSLATGLTIGGLTGLIFWALVVVLGRRREPDPITAAPGV